MKKIAKIALAATILLTLGATTVSADSNKGQKLYVKKLKKSCGITGAAMAAKHSQDEWSEVKDAGKIADEIKSICPDVKDKAVKEKYLNHYFDFFHNFANDSGNVPSC
ncbi:MAG: cytochrome C [Campylobacterota bacterium]|nr:cytochrome C [Campylobacterota bacterium]